METVLSILFGANLVQVCVEESRTHSRTTSCPRTCCWRAMGYYGRELDECKKSKQRFIVMIVVAAIIVVVADCSWLVGRSLEDQLTL